MHRNPTTKRMDNQHTAQHLVTRTTTATATTSTTAALTVAAPYDPLAGDVHQSDGLGVSGLEPNGRPGEDVQALTVRSSSVESELLVGLDEVVVRTDLVVRRNNESEGKGDGGDAQLWSEAKEANKKENSIVC